MAQQRRGFEKWKSEVEAEVGDIFQSRAGSSIHTSIKKAKHHMDIDSNTSLESDGCSNDNMNNEEF